MKDNRLTVIVLFSALAISFLYVQPIQYASAISLVSTSYGGTPTSIIRAGSKVFVGSVTSDDVKIYSQSSKSLLATITGITNPFLMGVNSGETRAYAFGASLYEFDVANNVLLRTLAHGCNVAGNFEIAYFDSTNNYLYCATSTNTIKQINLVTFATDQTSTTLNTGASACTVADFVYSQTDDILFATCGTGTPERVVSVESPFLSGTPDFEVVKDNNLEIAYNENANTVMVCSTSTDTDFYQYTIGVGFSVATQAQAVDCAVGNSRQHLVYDDPSDRFVFASNALSDNRITFFDGTDGAVLYSNVPYSGSGSVFQVSAYTDTLHYYFANLQTGFWDEFDATGIALGGGGTEPDDPSGGIDCTLPANANILICRLGSDPNCNGTVLGCVGDVVLGNSTDDSDSGLIDVICGVGFIDCNANPDIKTNGIGYLLLAIALGIEIGILWVASRGDLRQVPTFIWFIATIAIIAALTLFNWIDATMLVLGVIVAVALAAAKARGFFGGDSF